MNMVFANVTAGGTVSVRTTVGEPVVLRKIDPIYALAHHRIRSDLDGAHPKPLCLNAMEEKGSGEFAFAFLQPETPVSLSPDLWPSAQKTA